MSGKTLASITRGRLDDWRQTLEDANATPIVMLGVGHGPTEGELHIFFPENASYNAVRNILRTALGEIEMRERPI